MKAESFKSFASSADRISWIIEGLIPGSGWTYLVGPPGSGKTFLALQMCKAINDGEPFMDFPTKKMPALFIQADSPDEEWREQVRRVAPQCSGWTVFNCPSNVLDSPEEVTKLKEVVHGRMKGIPYKFGFVVFDSLNFLTAQELNTKMALKTIDAMKAICTDVEDDRQSMTPFLLIHHPKGDEIRGVNAGAGYKGISGSCSTVLTFANGLLVLEKGRLVKSKEIELRQDDQGLWHSTSFITRVAQLKPQIETELELERLYPELRGSI